MFFSYLTEEAIASGVLSLSLGEPAIDKFPYDTTSSILLQCPLYPSLSGNYGQLSAISASDHREDCLRGITN